eukprot:152770-Rhodomonas_salina.1
MGKPLPPDRQLTIAGGDRQSGWAALPQRRGPAHCHRHSGRRAQEDASGEEAARRQLECRERACVLSGKRACRTTGAHGTDLKCAMEGKVWLLPAPSDLI